VRKSASKVANRTSASGRTGAGKRKSGTSATTVSGNGAMPRTTGSDDSRPFLPADGGFSHVGMIG
jgi:hypothetical protein